MIFVLLHGFSIFYMLNEGIFCHLTIRVISNNDMPISLGALLIIRD